MLNYISLLKAIIILFKNKNILINIAKLKNILN